MNKKLINNIFIIFIFMSPLFQGLYFYHSVYFATVILLILLLCNSILYDNVTIEISINHGCILVGLILYFLTIFYGIDKGMAFIGFLKILTIYIFYLVIMQLDYNKDSYINALSNSGIYISLLGIAGFFIPILGQELIQKGRLGSFFQYPNTCAVFLLICIIFITAKKKLSIYYLIGITIISASIFLTFSRSMYIISVVVIITIIIYDKSRLKYLFPTCVMGVLLGYIVMILSNTSHIFNRIEKTSISASEWLTRLLYYQDSLSIIREYPFGTGHLGYYYIQRIYQTGSTYYVKYIHSNALQIVMDIGIIGFILIAIYFIFNIFNKELKFHEKLAIIVIFGHGAIDFDWEFPVILFFLLLIVYIDKDKLVYKKIHKTHMTIFFIICIFLYSYMGVSTYFAYNNDYEKSLQLYNYNTVVKENLAKKYIKIDTKKAYKLADNIIKQNKYSLKAYIIKRDIDYEMNKLHEALISAKKVTELNPLDITHLEKYCQILLDVAKLDIEKGNIDTANSKLEIIINIPYYIDRLAKERLTDYNVKHKPNIYMTEQLIRLNTEAEKLLF